MSYDPEAKAAELVRVRYIHTCEVVPIAAALREAYAWGRLDAFCEDYGAGQTPQALVSLRPQPDPVGPEHIVPALSTTMGT
jgi:hypothetical protein